MDKSAKLTPLKMFFRVNTGICQPAILVYWRVHVFFAAPHGNRCPLRLVSCPRTPTCVITKTATAVPNDIKVEGHLLGNSYDSVWGLFSRFPPQKHECMYQGGGLRISESVNQEGMNLESCSCIFFFEGE